MFRLLFLGALVCVSQGVDPLSTLDPRSVLPSVSRTDTTGTPSKYLSALLSSGAPLPTNSWFMNFVLPPGEDLTNNVFTFPSVHMATSAGLSVSDPWVDANEVQQQANFDPVVEPVLIGSSEIDEPYQLLSFDDLTATLDWDGKMTTTVARGQAFTTMRYDGSVTAQISTSQTMSSMTVDGEDFTCGDNTTSLASEVLVSFIQSDATYLIHFSTPAELICSESFSLQTKSAYSGYVQLALANNCTTGFNAHHCADFDMHEPADQSEWLQMLRDSVGVYVTGGEVSYEVDDDEAVISFEYSTETVLSSQVELLMLSMPHHRGAGLSTATETSFFKTIRGAAKAHLGSTWTMKEKLSPNELSAPRPISDEFRDEVLSALKADSTYDLAENYQLGAGDTYFSGKMIAKMARLAVIADELDETEVRDTILETLKQRITVWLSESAEARFLYDETWGGIVNCGCDYDDCGGECTPHCANVDKTGPGCPALTDQGMNFGNGAYNDHHFHYGYHVYGAAVVSSFDPVWAEEQAESLLFYVRDYMNPSADDDYMVKWRMLDWFAGHSWAGGILAYYNGRNQESTSESIHAYYAAALFGKALKGISKYSSIGKTLEDAGRVVLATELRSSHMYWHVTKGDFMDDEQLEPNIYDEAFRKNGIVGILWSGLAQFQTWFGSDAYFVHGIQTVPFTPVSEFMLPKSWIEEEYSRFSAACTGACASSGWASFVVMEQAIIDKESAWKAALELPDEFFSNDDAGGNGNSKTAMLHWIATRE